MRILLAFDKFKGAMTAGEACTVTSATLRSALPEAVIDEAPLTDGGEGFCSILTEGAGGYLEWHEIVDPLGRPLSAPIGWVDSSDLTETARGLVGLEDGKRIAVVEMASASGLLLLDPSERDPWKTSTYGTGELIRIAADDGADLILLGVGGSATNDCGAGVLEALGVEFTSRRGFTPRPEDLGDADREINPLLRKSFGITPAQFSEIDAIEFSSAQSLPPVLIASDVESPLLGEAGATHVFGPQKGLKAVAEMESAVERLALLLASSSRLSPDPSSPGMGAAGGIAFGLSALTQTRIVPGFSLVSEWMGLPAKLEAADWLFTGEGKLDKGSLSGKGPVALLRSAARSDLRSVVIAGIIEDGIADALSDELGDCSCYQLSNPEWSLSEAFERAKGRLEEVVRDWTTR
ncbi:MAG: glycerate kinase [Verrucomicrobiota bacterium]